VKSLRVHTIEQAIDDLVYFAQTVKLPMPGGDNVTPDQVPWILIGGSYAGELRFVLVSELQLTIALGWLLSRCIDCLDNDQVSEIDRITF
jgi:hypothetical protein